MKPIDGPIRMAPAASIRRVEARGAEASPSAGPAVPSMGALGAGGTAPVDHDRVAAIRSAVAEGRYPLMPQEIADAMIAAPFLLAADKD